MTKDKRVLIEVHGRERSTVTIKKMHRYSDGSWMWSGRVYTVKGGSASEARLMQCLSGVAVKWRNGVLDYNTTFKRGNKLWEECV